jgi:hypothetical protein
MHRDESEAVQGFSNQLKSVPFFAQSTRPGVSTAF